MGATVRGNSEARTAGGRVDRAARDHRPCCTYPELRWPAQRHAGHGEFSSVGLKNETVDPSRARISAITGLWMPASLKGTAGNGAEVQPRRAW